MNLSRENYFKQENWQWHTVFSFIIGIFCLISILLFGNIFISSFKTNTDIFSGPWGFPHKFVVSNYVKLVNDGFLKYYLNSFIIMITAIVVILVFSSFAAYGLGKFSFKGNRFLRNYFLIGLMFPVQLGIIPLFNLMKSLHLINSLLSVILIYSAGLSIPIFIMTNFLQSIPDAMRESAKIDGAGELRIFLKIFFPMMKPAIGALIPLNAVGLWNDFFIPLVFLSNEQVKTVPLGLMQYFTGKGFDITKIGLVFTAVSLSIIPMLIIYLFGSSKIIGGLTQGTIK